MRILCLLFVLLVPTLAPAQERDSVFASYEDYARFVDSRVMGRRFIELIQVLGGRDEYTPEQLQGADQRFRAIYPRDFSNGAVTKQIDLGSGFGQEMRIYWDEGTGYIYYYALLHNRGDRLVVINFTLNSNVDKVLEKF